MPTTSKPMFLGAVVLCFSLSTATAGIVNISSGLPGLPGESNDRTGNDVVLVTPWGAPIWQTPSAALGSAWISYVQSGWGTGTIQFGQMIVAVPDLQPECLTLGCTETIDLNAPTATFFKTFTLSDPAVSGFLNVWADDATMVLLDGTTIIPQNNVVTRGTACQAGPTSCGPAQGSTFTGFAGLSAGTHTLTFRTYQIWGDTFGLLYEGQITTAPALVPEPSTLLLLSAGVILFKFRRRGH